MNLYGSICLTDIPKELIRTGKNGKKYISVKVNERRSVGQYGDTHYIKIAAKKGAVAEGTNLYIGDLKPSQFQDEQQPAPQSPTIEQFYGVDQQSDDPNDENDELPF